MHLHNNTTAPSNMTFVHLGPLSNLALKRVVSLPYTHVVQETRAESFG